MNGLNLKILTVTCVLHGAVVTCHFITQEVGGLNTYFIKKKSTDTLEFLEFI